MRAFVFPGQGTQFVGMCREDYQASQAVKRFMDRANEILKYNLASIMFEGPKEMLNETLHAQPAILIHSCYLTEAIPSKPDFVAGHSLGEFSALVCAGVLSFETALKLVQIRARLMHQACLESQGTMAAIVGLTQEEVASLCQTARNDGDQVWLANANSNQQMVVSGGTEAVLRLMEASRQAGARLIKRLEVAGAFHSPVMVRVREQFEIHLQNTDFRDASIPVFENTVGQPITSGETLKHLICQQITSPVLWMDSIQTMIDTGCHQFVEIGPGQVLSRLIANISKEEQTTNINNLSDLSKC